MGLTRKEYNKKYYDKNKEKFVEYHRAWREKYPERVKQYYEENKDKLLESSRIWRQNNKSRFTKMVNRRRKEVAEELKKQGQMFTYMPKTERERKMVEFLAKKWDINIETSRKVLEENNWNVKGLVKERKDFNEKVNNGED